MSPVRAEVAQLKIKPGRELLLDTKRILLEIRSFRVGGNCVKMPRGRVIEERLTTSTAGRIIQRGLRDRDRGGPWRVVPIPAVNRCTLPLADFEIVVGNAIPTT